MPDDARRDAAFYDHENEPRRHVVDWGADDLFTRMPRRRTVHTPPPPRARRPAPLDPVHRPGSEPSGRFERLDGEVPSAGDVLSSGRRFAPSEDRDDRAADDARSGRRFTAPERRHPEKGTRPAPGRTASTDGEPRTGATDADARVVRRVERSDKTVDSPRQIRGAASGGDGVEDRADAAVVRPAGGPASDRWTDAVDGRWSSEMPGGRRTVVISGRPEGVARPRPDRHRPPRTVAERLGPRPERIVAWAFALGLLLIIIAIATADAGHV